MTQTPQGAKCAGVLERRGGQLILRKAVDSARHMLRLPEEARAFDLQVLREAEAAGVRQVEVEDERGRLWWVPLAHLLTHGQRFDRGWGEQLALPLRSWSFLPADTAARALCAEVGT